MFACVAVPLTCWVAALIAIPRKSLPGNEVQETVYSRLLGRQECLRLLAIVATAGALIVEVLSLPQRLDPDLRVVRQARAECATVRYAASNAADYGVIILAHCYALQPGGMWAEQVEKSDGSWLIVATLASPPLLSMWDTRPMIDPRLGNG